MKYNRMQLFFIWQKYSLDADVIAFICVMILLLYCAFI